MIITGKTKVVMGLGSFICHRSHGLITTNKREESKLSSIGHRSSFIKSDSFETEQGSFSVNDVVFLLKWWASALVGAASYLISIPS